MMAEFPAESVAKAKEIADQYRQRWNSQKEWASRLYDGAFLEISYGFDEAIRSGRCGHFLHQMKSDADCFSFAGALYLVARELGLKPKLYEAFDMKDVEYGESPLEQMVADHCFVSGIVRGKETAIDRQMNAFGRMEVYDDRIVIKKEGDDAVKRIPTERSFSMLKQISESEYVEKMLEHQSPEGGRITLGCGQRVVNHGKNIFVQYIPLGEELATFGVFKNLPHIVENYLHQNIIVELLAPLNDSGVWLLDEGEVSMFLVQNHGWTREQHSQPSRKITLPYTSVKDFLENLETAAAAYGRKTSLRMLRSKDPTRFMEERGFSPLGEVISDNGVDRKRHARLLEEIVRAIPLGKEPEEVADEIDQEAAYTALCLARRCPENYYGLLYPKEARRKFVDEHLQLTWEDHINYSRIWYSKLLAKGGFQDNQKEIERKIMTFKNRKDETDMFNGYLAYRREDRDLFDRAIDFALFQKEHPLGSVKAGEEEKLGYYRRLAFENLIRLSWLLPSLEIKKYQPGLKRILART